MTLNWILSPQLLPAFCKVYGLDKVRILMLLCCKVSAASASLAVKKLQAGHCGAKM